MNLSQIINNTDRHKCGDNTFLFYEPIYSFEFTDVIDKQKKEYIFRIPLQYVKKDGNEKIEIAYEIGVTSFLLKKAEIPHSNAITTLYNKILHIKKNNKLKKQLELFIRKGFTFDKDILNLKWLISELILQEKKDEVINITGPVLKEVPVVDFFDDVDFDELLTGKVNSFEKITKQKSKHSLELEKMPLISKDKIKNIKEEFKIVDFALMSIDDLKQMIETNGLNIESSLNIKPYYLNIVIDFFAKLGTKEAGTPLSQEEKDEIVANVNVKFSNIINYIKDYKKELLLSKNI